MARNLGAEIAGKHYAVAGDLSGNPGGRRYSPSPNHLV